MGQWAKEWKEMRKLHRRDTSRHGEQGAVMALAAISMVVLILILGLAVDIGHLYSVRTELHNAADAAAISGAAALNGTPGGITTAQAQATAPMNFYEFNKDSVDAANIHVYYASSFADLNAYLDSTSGACPSAAPNGSTVRTAAGASPTAANVRYVGVCVSEPAASQIFFVSNVIGDTLALHAKAIAGNSPPVTGICDALAPLSVVDRGTPLVGTISYTLRDAPGGSVSPGNYQLLSLPDCDGTTCPGASCVRERLRNNSCGCFDSNSTVDTKPGVSAGPVRDGLNDRFAQDTNIKENITYAEYSANHTPSGYTNPDGTFGRRILVVPIIKEAYFESGRTTDIPLDGGFAAFFMKTQVGGGSGGEITMEYIPNFTISNGTFNAGATPIPSLTIPVLYR